MNPMLLIALAPLALLFFFMVGIGLVGLAMSSESSSRGYSRKEYYMPSEDYGPSLYEMQRDRDMRSMYHDYLEDIGWTRIYYRGDSDAYWADRAKRSRR